MSKHAKLSEVKKNSELKQLREEEMKKVQGGNILVDFMLYGVIIYGVWPPW